MGNISTQEKVIISFFGILFAPVILVYRFVIKPIGQTVGLIAEEHYEITPEQQAANEALAAQEAEKIEKAD